MVSFSVSSKAQPAIRRPSNSPSGGDDDPDNDEGFQNNRVYITEFDSSESPPDTSKTPNNLVIPPKPNEWNPQRRHLPQAIQFHVDDSTSVDAAADSVAYGLNLRHNDKSLPAAVDPTLQKLREELAKLPDVSDGFDDYEAVPVEGFGRALLAGYGWQEGMGIGLNAKDDVKVVVFQGRAGRVGLGYTGVDHPANVQQEVPML